MHELEFDAEMIQSLVNIFGKFHAKRLVETSDIAHHMRLCEHVIVAEQGLVGRTIQRNDVAEHTAVFRLQVAELPVGTFGGNQGFGQIHMFLERIQPLHRLFSPLAIQHRLQRIQRRTAILDEFT